MPNSKYTPTIGLEIHIQLKTKSKMFCGCDNNAEGKAPNGVVCPVCMGFPGVLPTPNRQALEWAIKLGKFLNGRVASETKFDRKHYFYPDLPKAYQISQYDQPVVVGGIVNIDGNEIHLERIHIEEDAGKLIHIKKDNYSLVDLNRAGTPLLEVVTKPEITSPQEAKKFMQRLRTVVRYLGISDGDMEKGHLRCDANISIAKSQISNLKSQNNGIAARSLGTPVEIKNLNSFLMVERALTYEIERQSQLLERGEKITKETRGWDDGKNKTVAQRTKEVAPDYRYFPEPDLPPMSDLEQEFDVQLPESIENKIEKLKNSGITQQDVDTIISDDKLMLLVDEIIASQAEQDILKRAINLAINITDIRKLPVDFIVDLAMALVKNRVSQTATLPIIKMGLESHVSVDEAIKTGNFEQVSNSDELKQMVQKVIKENPQAVADYKAGKQNAIGFLTGQVVRASQGRANPQEIYKLLQSEL